MALLNSIQNGNNYKSLSSFIVQNKIGKGQFSVVYKALDINENKAVALKKVKISEMSDAKSRLDCLKEVNLLQRLNHPNIIKYIASFIELNELHIILELADAGDLAGIINKSRDQKRLIAEKTIWEYFVQIVLALQYMHSKSIMHRDIKPSNIFITTKGIVKIGDLGLGRFFSTKTFAAHSLVGTPYYMSPERISECGYNFKSDIWSVGCLLYELAALQSPFFGEKMNLYTLCKKIEICDYPPIPSNLYSQQLQDLVASCLRWDPLNRPDINFVCEIAKKMNDYFQNCSKNALAIEAKS